MRRESVALPDDAPLLPSLAFVRRLRGRSLDGQDVRQ
jgi:hypothetical protein